jgi:Gas vesicle protein G
VGLIVGLLTLPLSPVRGVAWLAERIQQQAETELYDESSIRAALLELEEARETGALSPEEIDTAEDLLIERLMEIRGVVQRRGDGVE